MLLHSSCTASRRALSTIAVGVSGGVDSSVAALLLKRQGHEVVGIHMSNWDHEEEGMSSQCSEREREDARRVCERIGIGFHPVSFVREYWQDVFQPFVDGIRAGGTPNPDVSCNQHIKFDRFHSYALSLGAEMVATGHYARVRHRPDGVSDLLTARDLNKDQTYFLSTISQVALRRTLFPLGDLLKVGGKPGSQSSAYTAHRVCADVDSLLTSVLAMLHSRKSEESPRTRVYTQLTRRIRLAYASWGNAASRTSSEATSPRKLRAQ